MCADRNVLNCAIVKVGLIPLQEHREAIMRNFSLPIWSLFYISVIPSSYTIVILGLLETSSVPGTDYTLP